jgi:protein gp37
VKVATNSSIEWTQTTWNPVTGCDRVTAGCDSCYALALSKRLKAMGVAKYQNDGNPATSGPGFGVTVHPGSLREPYSWSGSRLVFVNSMSDLFHAKVPIGFVRDIFDVIRETPQHTYQALTKRAHRLERIADRLEWPANLWMGVSVESDDVTERIDQLRSVPSECRFLSCEPLLTALPDLDLTGIDWVIVGGESGSKARPMDPAWATDIRDQCLAAGVAFFFKQWGGHTPKANGRTLDGRIWDEMPQPPRVKSA